MLSRHLFHSEAPDGEGPLSPSYLSTRDAPWLRALLAEHARFTGRRQKELVDRLREPLEPRAPKAKLELARRVLEAADGRRARAPVPPRELRRRLFLAALDARAPRATIVEQVATELGLGAADVERWLFSDLRGERRVAPLPRELTVEGLVLEANRALVTALLRRAASLRIRARGNTPALVRHVTQLGLICGLEREPSGSRDEVTMTVSGPFALFRHTEVYGRALASLVPRALACDQFELEVACSFGKNEQPSTVLVRSGDPIDRGPEQTEDDAADAGARFIADFTRIAKRWHVVPNVVGAHDGSAVLLSRFELVHCERGQRWLVEIAGYWTRAMVEARLSQLRATADRSFILCVDERRQCDRDEVRDLRVLRYRRRVDARAVLAAIEADAARP